MLDYFSYTDMEIEAFKSIMRLKHGFRTIVSACTGDIWHLLALINKVCTYTCAILHLADLFFQAFAVGIWTSIWQYDKTEVWQNWSLAFSPLSIRIQSVDQHSQVTTTWRSLLLVIWRISMGFNTWILLFISAHCGLRLILKRTHCKSSGIIQNLIICGNFW